MKNKKQQKKQTRTAHKASQAKQTFLEHIYELRSRLLWSVATLLVASSVGFAFKDILVNIILAPLQGEKLVYLTVGGGFSFVLTICLYFGAVITIPVIMYHLYRFLQPLLPKTSRRFTVTVILLSIGLALAGAAFGYFVAIRASIDFLMGFAAGAVTSNVTTESYLNFIVIYTAGLALIFQLPLLMFIFDRIRPFPPGSLLSSQRFVIAGATIVAALITPTPDAVNMMIIAIPIIAIYEIGALAVVLRHKLMSHEAISPVIKTIPVPVVAEPFQNIPDPEPIDRPTLPVQPKIPVLQPHRSLDGIRVQQPQVSRHTVVVPRRTQFTTRPHRGMAIDGVSIIHV